MRYLGCLTGEQEQRFLFERTGSAAAHEEIQIYRYKENRIQNSPQISDLRGIHILWHRQEGKEYDHKFEQ